jgi:hypothetical protein
MIYKSIHTYTYIYTYIHIYIYSGVVGFQNDDGANAIATIACFLIYSIYYYLYAAKRQKISPEEKVFFPVIMCICKCLYVHT